MASFKEKKPLWQMDHDSKSSVIETLKNYALTTTDVVKDIVGRYENLHKTPTDNWSKTHLRNFLRKIKSQEHTEERSSEFMVHHGHLPKGNHQRRYASPLSSRWALHDSEVVGYGAIRYCSDDAELRLTWSPLPNARDLKGYERKSYEKLVKCYRLTLSDRRQVPLYYYQDTAENDWYGWF